MVAVLVVVVFAYLFSVQYIFYPSPGFWSCVDCGQVSRDLGPFPTSIHWSCLQSSSVLCYLSTLTRDLPCVIFKWVLLPFPIWLQLNHWGAERLKGCLVLLLCFSNTASYRRHSAESWNSASLNKNLANCSFPFIFFMHELSIVFHAIFKLYFGGIPFVLLYIFYSVRIYNLMNKSHMHSGLPLPQKAGFTSRISCAVSGRAPGQKLPLPGMPVSTRVVKWECSAVIMIIHLQE